MLVFFSGCPTGEVRVTRGYNLPCKYIIHTASPYYNTKYRTAAETSLASCYRYLEMYLLCKLLINHLAYLIKQSRFLHVGRELELLELFYR